MLKLFLIACFLFVAVTQATNVGYNYGNSETHTTHHTQQPTHQQHQQQPQHNVGYEKHFYYFNAPEEHFEQQHQSHALKKLTQQKVKKNLQVIFIKPPEQKHHEKVVHNLVQHVAAPVEEKTHIYVLTKEPDHAKKVQHVQQQQQAITVQHHKPEVHFVKYHTPAEVHNIQQSIVQQYGGKPSDIVHLSGGSHGISGSGGNAPTVNFINGNKHQQHHEVNRQYLAPAISSSSSSPSVEPNYAKNFLPAGKDVVPGSSYIPPALRF